MKALRFYAPEDVRLEDQPEPTAGPDEVKIRVRNCSTCGTDVKIFHNGHQNLSPPRTIGHEIAGEIVEGGADVSRLMVRGGLGFWCPLWEMLTWVRSGEHTSELQS